MDDYRKIQSQIKYTVQYAPSDDTVEPNCKENLTGNKSYKFTYSLVIKLLILTGIGIVISIAAGLIFSYDSFSVNIMVRQHRKSGSRETACPD